MHLIVILLGLKCQEESKTSTATPLTKIAPKICDSGSSPHSFFALNDSEGLIIFPNLKKSEKIAPFA